MKPTTYVRPSDNREYAMFPCEYMTFQRGENYMSHLGSWAIDYIKGTQNITSTWEEQPIYAPFTGTCIWSSTTYGFIFRSKWPVIWANGIEEYATMYVAHARNIPATGQTCKQGDLLATVSDINSSGLIHLHLEAGTFLSTSLIKTTYVDPETGKYVWKLDDQRHCYDVFHIDDTVASCQYTWKKINGDMLVGSNTIASCWPASRFAGQLRGFSHMFYDSITDKTSDQYFLQQKCETDMNTAIRVYNNRYCVAVGQKIGKVGDYLNIAFDDGSTNGRMFYAVIGDVKKDKDTLDGAGWVGADGCVVEIIADIVRAGDLGIKSYSTFLYSYKVKSVCRLGDEDPTDGFYPDSVGEDITPELLLFGQPIDYYGNYLLLMEGVRNA